MITKFFSMFIVFAMLTVQSHATTQNGLKTAFDELNFALTVEWDQKDKNFHDAQLKKFSQTVRDLQAQGLTNAQLVDFAKSQIKDQKLAKEIETTFTMIQVNKMSAQEANKYVLDTVKNFYSTGASWNGEVFVYLAVGVLVVALAIAIAAAPSTGGGYGGGSGCYYQDVYVCDDYCYYDYWGYYTCYSDCYWTSYCY